MKNVLLTITQFAGGAFVLVGILAFVNLTTGSRIGLKGAAVPADPLFGVFMISLGGLVLGLLWFFGRRKSAAEPKA